MEATAWPGCVSGVAAAAASEAWRRGLSGACGEEAVESWRRYIPESALAWAFRGVFL